MMGHTNATICEASEPDSISLKRQLMIPFLFVVTMLGSRSAVSDESAGSVAAKRSMLKIALVQPVPCAEATRNIESGTEFCRAAATQGADIVVFPEMFSLGYHLNTDYSDPSEVERWRDMAKTVDGPFVTHFKRLASELDVAIVITYLENRDGDLRNSATLFDRHGTLVFTYSKVHLCSFFKMEGALTQGDGFYVAQLDTRVGPVNIGVMTCYDREFPESARTLMLEGAELILTPNACGLDALRINQFQVRAWENSVAVAMANYSEEKGNGHSCAFGADGKELLMAGEKEGLYFAELDLQELHQIRKKTYWGNAWRKPSKYKAMLSKDVQEPFVRVDAYGKPNDRRK